MLISLVMQPVQYSPKGDMGWGSGAGRFALPSWSVWHLKKVSEFVPKAAITTVLVIKKFKKWKSIAHKSSSWLLPRNALPPPVVPYGKAMCNGMDREPSLQRYAISN